MASCVHPAAVVPAAQSPSHVPPARAMTDVRSSVAQRRIDDKHCRPNGVFFTDDDVGKRRIDVKKDRSLFGPPDFGTKFGAAAAQDHIVVPLSQGKPETGVDVPRRSYVRCKPPV